MRAESSPQTRGARRSSRWRGQDFAHEWGEVGFAASLPSYLPRFPIRPSHATTCPALADAARHGGLAAFEFVTIHARVHFFPNIPPMPPIIFPPMSFISAMPFAAMSPAINAAVSPV